MFRSEVGAPEIHEWNAQEDVMWLLDGEDASMLVANKGAADAARQLLIPSLRSDG